MKHSLPASLYLGIALCLSSCSRPQENEPPRAYYDLNQPGWQTLDKNDFAHVNSGPDTWRWEDGDLHCTGFPISVLRTIEPYTNFEMTIDWMHLEPGGNSGVFIWTAPKSIERLQSASNPGPPLPDGIEIQMLDHAFADQAKARGEPTDWFTTHGDVFPVRAKMKPFPPLSPVPNQEPIFKSFGQEPFEIVGRTTRPHPGAASPASASARGTASGIATTFAPSTARSAFGSTAKKFPEAPIAIHLLDTFVSKAKGRRSNSAISIFANCPKTELACPLRFSQKEKQASRNGENDEGKGH